ncbi:MAG: pyrroline-5-carboxylate reductase [Armatimonadetes bacterium]|nr:pyrroline-5-carboxylate reductase [Armatimonadota bacterium]
MSDVTRIGFVGAGMMAEAIARGLLSARANPDALCASDPDELRRAVFREMGIRCEADNRLIVGGCDVIILAVKPFLMADVISDLADSVRPDQTIISIAAGITTSAIEQALRSDAPVVRAMPNTPCLVGEGAIAIAPGRRASHSHMDLAAGILGASGKVVRVTEDRMDAVTGLSGSGPAYVYMFIEALTVGGVREGLSRDAALSLAAQTVLGAAKMVIETGEHPAVLRDRVTTPAGTTIEGIASLEDDEFRSAVMGAVSAAAQRSREIGKSSMR